MNFSELLPSLHDGSFVKIFEKLSMSAVLKFCEQSCLREKKPSTR